MKDEQDAAYRASLAADKLKAEQRAIEERQEQERLLEKERRAQKKLQENAKHEVRRVHCIYLSSSLSVISSIPILNMFVFIYVISSVLA
jgi:hypothetical protein